MSWARCWRPITRSQSCSIQNPNQSPNSKKRCRWSETACHRNRLINLLKASIMIEEMHKSWGEQFQHTKWLSHIRLHSKIPSLCPRPGGIKRWCCLTSVCLTSDVCRVHPVGDRRVRPAGWMARIGWSGPARPAWLKAAAARFRCRPGRVHIVAAARLQLV